jgi:uncharacterized protein with von Willebrand factor type A (vWA) domain
LKLSGSTDAFNDWEGGVFTIQVLEVFRRWVWIFFRVETEWVRGAGVGAGVLQGPGMDDVLLGDYSSSGKDDDD